jgi:hypothetical protein
LQLLGDDDEDEEDEAQEDKGEDEAANAGAAGEQQRLAALRCEAQSLTLLREMFRPLVPTLPCLRKSSDRFHQTVAL